MDKRGGLPRWFFFSFITLTFLITNLVRAEGRVVRVGVYDNAPKIFTAESGKPAGIFIDLIEYIARKEGWTLQYVAGTWKEGLVRLERGEIDLMPDVAYSAARSKIYSFHRVPALSAWDQAYSRKGSGLHTILDLNGKRVALLEGSVQQEIFLQMADSFGLKMSVVAVSDFRQAFEIVARGEAEVVVANNFYGSYHARKYGLEGTAVIFNPSSLYFAAIRGVNEPLLQIIDVHLSEMKKDPKSVYYGSLKRWTAEEVRFELPLWVKVVGLGAGVILLMSVGGSIILKRQVNERTKELQAINREMEQRITARTLELEKAMARAQEADRLKSAFLATMSHELRTPLNSIIGFTGIILRERVGPLNDEQRKQLSMVRGSAHHLLALINDVLDISKIEAGQLQLAREEIDLVDIIEGAVSNIRPLAETKGLEVDCEISPPGGTVHGDSRRLEQVLLNLLSNAIKFTEKGSVKVTCGSDRENVIIRVIDTGIGIKQEDLQVVFEPFRQIDSGISRKYEGTGLGLSITKRLVELMGGQIEVTSQWGAGSTFTITLPKQRRG